MRRKKGVQEGFNTFLNALFLFHFISKMFSFFLQSNTGGGMDTVVKFIYEIATHFTPCRATIKLNHSKIRFHPKSGAAGAPFLWCVPF